MVSRHEDIRPEVCARCVFCCPWNGEGWGCAHDSVNGLLEGVVKCRGQYFLQFQPWTHPLGPARLQ